MNTFLQHLIPQHLLSRSVAKALNCKHPKVKNFIIDRFAKHYGVNMNEAIEPDLTAYADFNSFFTRALKPELRPIDTESNSIISPADGTISQIGDIKEQRILQAKGFEFSVSSLLGGSIALAETFQEGHFATVYLAPKDYHRVHMPVTGTLQSMRYVPGRLFSVNNSTAAAVPRLFARNERVICLFNTPLGEMAVILVGAMIVASIHTAWAGQIAPHKIREIHHWDYQHQEPIILEKGQELGHFQLGSTVIVLFAKNSMQWQPQLSCGTEIKMGQAIGTF